MKLWRLTLECGHLALDGPWGDREAQRSWIGGVLSCEVCPLVTDYRSPTPVMPVRLILNVEDVPGERYREPDSRAMEIRSEHLAKSRQIASQGPRR